MASLSRDLRRQLEKTIAGENGARRIAEAGAEQSLKRLAVDRHEPHTSLTPDERGLRNQLRAHGRQLGDVRDSQRGTQTIAHLKQAVAYEHWHRMLFARFLAENDLLLHPEHGVALSLDEVKELALGLRRDWIEIAAEYAQRMLLREVFRPDDPALRVPLPPETRLELEGKLNSLPREIFLADDSLGWVYQFWQRDAKDQVNRSEVKIGADELAPVTQLFTEDYMVLFLLENTLGAWWTARRGAPELPGYPWTYLRLNEDGSPCAGAFEGWPKSAKELKVLDPCMGSGHFLTFALPILAQMRAAEEGSSLAEAIAGVLRDNLFGLELDPRCSQIAAFNLALTAWKLAGQHLELPALNLACSGLGINAKEEDWIKLAGEDGRKQDLMRWLYSMFRNAPTLGSLIDPRRAGKPMVEHEIASLLPLLEQALAAERSTDETRELAIAAEGLLAAARILTERFTLVATNVPYLGYGRQDDVLKKHCETFHGDAKADLATCFVDRALRACSLGGSVALVTPQNWLFLTSYKKVRERLLKSAQWDVVARLGSRAFETITGEVVNVALLSLTQNRPSVEHAFAGWDVSSAESSEQKSEALKIDGHRQGNQLSQLLNPDSRISTEVLRSESLLSQYAAAYWGQGTGDFPRFGRDFWELSALGLDWAPVQSTVEENCDYSGRELVVYWQQGSGILFKLAEDLRRIEGNSGIRPTRGSEAWGKKGVCVSLMREIRVTRYDGHIFDGNCAAVVPHDAAHLEAVWAFCSSSEFSIAIRKLDSKLNVTTHTLLKVPFDLNRWQAIAQEQYPNGLAMPSSYDPTQWLFDGHPRDSDEPLQVGLIRLLGYQWPRQTGSNFPDCPALDSDEIRRYAAADGIVCLAYAAGEDNAAMRLRALMQAAYGSAYDQSVLLSGSGASTLEEWLRDKFFAKHCEIFKQRPFVWHIWDGLNDGFHAFVNYHKLDRKTLEKLIYFYLGDWLTRQRQDLKSGVEGADTRLAAAEHLQGESKKILEGEKPYDGDGARSARGLGPGGSASSRRLGNAVSQWRRRRGLGRVRADRCLRPPASGRSASSGPHRSDERRGSRDAIARCRLEEGQSGYGPRLATDAGRAAQSRASRVSGGDEVVPVRRGEGRCRRALLSRALERGRPDRLAARNREFPSG